MLFHGEVKIAYIISLFTGRALQWAQAIWEQGDRVTHNLEAFNARFREVFDQSTHTIRDQLFHLKQGSSSVADYALQFRTLATASGWNEAALMTAYRHGLPRDLRLLLAIYDDNVGLETLIQHSLLLSKNLAT